MANSQTGPLIYIDTEGAVTTARTLIAYIAVTGDNSNDYIILSSTESGPPVIKLSVMASNDTKVFDFSRIPLVFPNGVFVQDLASGAVATIVTTQAGK